MTTQDYKLAYHCLFNCMTDMLEAIDLGLERDSGLRETLIVLKYDIYAAQRQAEAMHIDAPEPGFTLLPGSDRYEEKAAE